MRKLDNVMDVAERLKNLRHERKLTPGQLSRRLEVLLPEMTFQNEQSGHIGRNIISNVEHGKGITPNMLRAYSQEFNVSLEYLFCLADERQPQDKTYEDDIGLSSQALATLRHEKTLLGDNENNSFDEGYYHVTEIINLLLGEEYIPFGKNILQAIQKYVFENPSAGQYDNEIDSGLTRKNKLSIKEILASQLLNIQMDIARLRDKVQKNIS